MKSDSDLQSLLASEHRSDLAVVPKRTLVLAFVAVISLFFGAGVAVGSVPAVAPYGLLVWLIGTGVALTLGWLINRKEDKVLRRHVSSAESPNPK